MIARGEFILETFGEYADHVANATSLHVLESDFFGYGRVLSAKDSVALLEHTWALDNILERC